MAKRGNIGDKLTDQQRREVVMRLAMFDTVSEIHADLIADGVNISIQALGHYNPERTTARTVSQKWTDLFHITREGFLKEIAAEPIANRAYRLRRLEEVRRKAMALGDFKEANKALEQAAKEVGNIFTNVQIIKGNAAQPGAVDTDAMTPDERRNMLADRLKEAIEKLQAQKGVTVQ